MISILLPRVGEGILEVTLNKWLKKKGDFIKKGEVIAEISTDKVDSDVLADQEGIVEELLYKEGEDMPVGKPIINLRDTNDTTEKTAPPIVTQDVKPIASDTPPIEKDPEVKKVSSPTSSKGNIPLSPLVSKMLATNNISLTEIENLKGSGRGGRITKEDVNTYLLDRNISNLTERSNKHEIQEAPPINETKIITEKTEVASSPAQQTEKPNSTIETEAPIKKPLDKNLKGEIVDLDRVRLLIADNLKNSQSTSVHVTSFAEADITAIVDWKKNNGLLAQSSHDTKLTFTPILAYVIVRALMKYPLLNATSLGNTKFIKHKDIHLGLAVAQPNNNLIVPVIRNAINLNILGLAKEINRLAKEARTYALSSVECRGSTFTISNIGNTGTLFGTPIINQPELGILAIGAIKKRPHVIERDGQEAIAIRSILHLSLSYDHRIIDGQLGGAFLKELITQLENFNPATNLL